MASAIYYLLLSLFTVICFVPFAVLFALTVFFDKERVALHWASRVWSYGIFRLCPLWKLRVEGREKIDRSRPWVIVTNHQSMLDIPLMYVLPLNFKWVSKKEVQKMPIFGWVLWMHGDIPVERGSRRSAKRMMERCVERLSRGTSVIVFPEGTRTRTGEIGRFKDGAFLVAKSAGVGIQPDERLARADAAHLPRAGARSDSARAGRFLGSPGAGRTDRSVDEGGARTDAFRREIEYFEESS